MRDINRIDPMLQKIGEIWKQYPDLRLGQLLENVSVEYNSSLFFTEDADLIRKLEGFYIKHERVHQ